jgi:hypothetical protein
MGREQTGLVVRDQAHHLTQPLLHHVPRPVDHCDSEHRVRTDLDPLDGVRVQLQWFGV